MPVRVSEVMDKDVPTVKPDMKLHDFVKFLVKHSIRFAPVVNEAGLVVGGISETDLMKLIRVQPLPTVSAVWTNLPRNIGDKPISEVMNPRPITISERAEAIEALNMMNVANVHILIVTDINNNLAGLVRLRRILEKMLEKV